MANSIVLERLPLLEGSVFPVQTDYQRQRIYILPTKQGLVFSILLFVMLLGAINYTNSMAYLLTFLLGSLFMVCMLHTYRNLRGLVFKTPATQSVFAGETAHFPLLIDNRSGLQRTSIVIEAYPKAKRQRLLSDAAPLLLNIEANEFRREYLSLSAKKRGYLKPGRLRISSTFPLGLFKAWAYMQTDQTCLVYPQPAGDPRLPLFEEHDSERQTGTRSGTDDFIGFRPYHSGDSVRNIDWKVFAKEQGLLVKRFTGHGANKLLLSWDQCGRIHDAEQRLSQLCLWVIEAEKQGLHYGLEIPACSIAINSGPVHQTQCLRALAAYGYSGNDR